METLKKVQHFIDSNRLLTPNSRILIGVSGGKDSVVLLNIMTKLGYNCVVAHCNFHLRDKESDNDALFVQKLAKEYGLVFKRADFDTKEYARKMKISIEMAARDLRYDWFEKIAKEVNAKAILVAHHANDSIETIIINILRGTGLKGLTGIEPINGNIIRPLLCCNRSEIEEYVRKNELEYVYDMTNFENDYNRNKIRNQVLPVLYDINPSIEQTITENILRIRGAWKIYNQKIKEIIKDITFEKDGFIYVDIKKLKQQADISTALFEILQCYHFNSDIVSDIVHNLDGESGLRYLSASHTLIKDRDFLIIEENEQQNLNIYEIESDIAEINEPIHLEIKHLKANPAFIVSKKQDLIHIDADKVSFPLILRRWKEGDNFFPFGMKNSKKLSDFFIDEKKNLFEKKNSWLLLSNDEIIWIVGQRLDNRFRVTDNTKNIIEITYFR